jgi:hypothetical protein
MLRLKRAAAYQSLPHRLDGGGGMVATAASGAKMNGDASDDGLAGVLS